jgi:N-glycosylase/DNA lyase
MKRSQINRNAQLDEMTQNYKVRRNAIKRRLQEFSNVPPSEYFYELAYCLLTPQSSAAHAEQVVAKLKEARFQNRDVNPAPFLRQKECYIRFHNMKSRYLVLLKGQFAEIAKEISKSENSYTLRDWLVKNVLGLGYKEATHFLRNIGKNDGLAILDRHILRTLKNLGVISSIPASINKKTYIKIELRFAKFASDIGIVLDELDLVFWSMQTGEIRK